MHKKLRRASRLLATAVALGGLTGQTLAQAPSLKPVPTQTALAPVPMVQNLNPAQALWAEINVELALLADEMTFPGPITAKVQGTQLELSGVVSSEAARKRALELAHTHGLLAVKDSLRVQPGLAVKPIQDSHTPLSTTAGALLNQQLREKSAGLQIAYPGEGKLVIRGSVGSFEEKLAISKVVQQTPGCRSVVNETTVTPVPFQGKNWHKVSKDGKLTVAATPAATESPLHSAVAETPAPPTAKPIQPAGYQPMPTTGTPPTTSSGSDYRLVPVPTSSTSTTPTTPIYQTQASSTYPAMNGTSPMVVQSASPQPKPSGGLFSRLFSRGEDVAPPPQPSYTYPYQSGGRVVPQPQPQPTYSYSSGGRVTPQPLGMPATSTTAPVPGATVQSPGSTLTSTPTLAGNGPVTSGAAPTTPSSPAVPVSAADLKRKVEAVTAGRARDVAVVGTPDGKTLIKFTVPSEAAERELRQKVLDFPEMKSANMRMEITISGQ